MRKTNWLFLLSLSSGTVTLAAGLAVWLSLRHRPPEPLYLPERADARTYGEMALNLAHQTRYGDALRANARALSYSPGHASLLYNQAWLEARQGRMKQSLALLDRAMSRAPDDADIRYTRAWVLQQLGRASEAKAAFKRAQDLTKRFKNPHQGYARARLLQLEGQHGLALKAFDEALKREPVQPPGFYYWRSRSLRVLKRYRPALEDLSLAMAGEATARLYRERAALYEQLGQLPEALGDLDRSRMLEPTPVARLAHARLQLELDPAAGRAEIDELLKADPKWLPARLLQARALMDARQLKPAQKALAQMLHDAPDSGEALWLQGVLFRVQRKYPLALAAYEKARQQGYSQAEIDLELARLATQQGRKSEARLRVIKALQQQPELRRRVETDRLLKKIAKTL